ncbi:MAG: polysaccharide biosynthesis protein [Lachnospiraceae bacterium]
MYEKNAHPLITGTLILTLAGFLSRIIGFFYRIFLSQTIGAEGIGIYQLVTPVFVICFSVAAAGMQSAISRFVAAAYAKPDEREAKLFLFCGCFLSLLISIFLAVVLYRNAGLISEKIILEKRCEPLVKILAFSLPLESIHACISGFYFGIKDSRLPAVSQIVEQLTRVLFVCALFTYYRFTEHPFTLSVVVLGTVVGELFSVFLCIAFLKSHFQKQSAQGSSSLWKSSIRTVRLSVAQIFDKLVCFSLPLTANRTIVSLLCSVEAVYIPSRLQAYGYSTADALSIYGIFTGMALPLILFPSAITNSAAVMLLPVVSESEMTGNNRFLLKTIRRTAASCISIGFICTLAFLVFGDFAGYFLFHNRLAGSFITTLSFICPFLYLNTALASILHGLGKTMQAFLINCAAIGIRLFFTFLLIPQIGIKAVLYGLLASQILSAALHLLSLSKAGYPLFTSPYNFKLKKHF